MLIIEYSSNGRHIVRLRKDWHPGRIGRAYTPPVQRTISKDAFRIQTLLLRKTK
jgi:hypothetical protein